VHSQAIKNTQLVQPQQTLIIIVIYWPLCIRMSVYMHIYMCVRVYLRMNFMFIKVDRGKYCKRHDCERIIHKNASVEFTSRSINNEAVCKYKRCDARFRYLLLNAKRRKYYPRRAIINNSAKEVYNREKIRALNPPIVRKES